MADGAILGQQSLTLPTGATGTRPTASTGMLRFNTTTSFVEFYDGTGWVSVSVAPALSGTKYSLTSGMLSYSGLQAWSASNAFDGAGTGGGTWFHTDNAGAGSYFALDLGSGQVASFGRAKLYQNGGLYATWSIQYSNDNSNWTTVYSGMQMSTGSAGVIQADWPYSNNNGFHRYWRFYKTDGAVGGGYHMELEMFNYNYYS
jgi:hypothetical protein